MLTAVYTSISYQNVYFDKVQYDLFERQLTLYHIHKREIYLWSINPWLTRRTSITHRSLKVRRFVEGNSTIYSAGNSIGWYISILQYYITMERSTGLTRSSIEQYGIAQSESVVLFKYLVLVGNMTSTTTTDTMH